MNHPVSDIATIDTTIPSVKVVLVPMLWDNYSFIVTSGNQAAIIDPSEFSLISQQIEFLGLHVSSVLITHEHHDHIGGVKQLYRKYKPEIIAPKGAVVPFVSTEVTHGSKISVGEITFEVIHVPGHYSSPYSVKSMNNNIAWYAEKPGILFTGDTLFSCGYGYITNGSEKTMWESLQKMRSLPDSTLVFCGHEYTLKNTQFAVEIDPENARLIKRFDEVKNLLKKHLPTIPTTLQLEKSINPFLRWDDEQLKNRLGISHKTDYESFVHIRALKNEYNKRS